jgi:hypothetical protein
MPGRGSRLERVRGASRCLSWDGGRARSVTLRCRSEGLKCSGLREPFYALRAYAIVSESLADFSPTSSALMHRVSLGLLGTV